MATLLCDARPSCLRERTHSARLFAFKARERSTDTDLGLASPRLGRLSRESQLDFLPPRGCPLFLRPFSLIRPSLTSDPARVAPSSTKMPASASTQPHIAPDSPRTTSEVGTEDWDVAQTTALAGAQSTQTQPKTAQGPRERVLDYENHAGVRADASRLASGPACPVDGDSNLQIRSAARPVAWS